MASSSGTTSTGTLQNTDLNEEYLQKLMDQRKMKRMTSNRESARRSRMKKQKHLDDLMAQLARLIKENNQIITTMSFTTEHYLNLEAENSILRVRMAELTSRLQSLNKILSFFDIENGSFPIDEELCHNAIHGPAADIFMFSINNSMNYMCAKQLSTDMLQYWS